MTTARRVASVEGSLQPLEIVLKVIAEAQEHADLQSYALAVAEAPLEASPMFRIASEVEASLRTASKGRPRDEVDRAVRRAVGDSIFRYVLFLRLNSSAVEVADREGLRAAATFYWMGCLLSGPRREDLEPAEWQEHEQQQAGCWQQWRSVVASMLVLDIVEEEAREELEARYLGGRPALLADAEQAWDRFAEMVDRLWSISENLHAGSDPGKDNANDDALASRVAERVRHLADDARISTLERLGEMPRAVEIVERRMRGY